ncbi:hypothetical protein HY310_00500 [Candidatus Microgenomates bacterium]|nr:hypothetical protein [Candidatus Microgenomates bacterium]
MRILIEENEPVVKDLPDGDVVLFCGQKKNSEYCVIFGPAMSCIPLEASGSTELFDALVAIGGENEEMRIHQVKHGHKYFAGGGFVELKDETNLMGDQIFFRLPDDPKGRNSHFHGEVFKEVYAVL